MPKYGGNQIFSHGSFPEVGETEGVEEKKKKVGENNGQLRFVRHHGCKHAWTNRVTQVKVC